MVVRLQRLSDYPVSLSTVKHGDCPSEHGQIREKVGSQESPVYRRTDLNCLLQQLRLRECTQDYVFNNCIF